MARRRDNAPVEEDESWMTTYADAITLLMAFFVMLVSFSDVNLPAFNLWRISVIPDYESRNRSSSVGGTAPENRYGGTLRVIRRWGKYEVTGEVAYHYVEGFKYVPGTTDNSIAAFLALRYSFL